MSKTFNIAARLEAQAKTRPYQRAVVFPAGRDRSGRDRWSQLSFLEAQRLVGALALGLEGLGVRRGDRVSLLVRPSLSFIPLVFALFRIGAVPVLIDPGMGRKSFLSCLERMRPRVLIAVPLVHALRGLFPRAFASVEVSVTAGPTTGWWGGATLDGLRASTGPVPAAAATAEDEVAAILFTSGSTGPAKGVVYTHGIFETQTRLIQTMYGIEPGGVDLACFPLFGLFSAGLGLTVVIPELDPTRPAAADPARLVSAIEAQGCTQAFGSPAIWRNVARYCQERGVKLPSLKRILMAGAPVPTALHAAFSEILSPGAEVFTPYGATEALPVASIGSAEVLNETGAQTAAGAGTCVGRPAPEAVVRILRSSDEPIDRCEEVGWLLPREVGEITVRGPMVTPRYEGEPEATGAAKMTERGENGETWTVHRMGDVGYLDDAGRLWFCGRKRHVVSAPGGPMYPVPCEAIFDVHPDVKKTALVGVAGTPMIVVELDTARADKDGIAAELLELAEQHPHTRSIKRVLFHPKLPVDVRHNAKIDREALAAWAARQ